MPRNTLIIVAIAVILAAVGIVSWSQQGAAPVATPSVTQERPSPTLAPISTPVPVQISTVRGSVTAVSAVSITVKTATETKTISLAQVRDVQKLTSGTLEGGNVQTGKATIADVKEGQEVLVVADKAGTNAISILIVK